MVSYIPCAHPYAAAAYLKKTKKRDTLVCFVNQNQPGSTVPRWARLADFHVISEPLLPLFFFFLETLLESLKRAGNPASLRPRRQRA